MRLDTNWILQEPIDLEHKQYVLLDYINKVDKDFDENAKFQADLLSQRMDRRSIMTAREQAQLWIDEFFYGVSN